MQRNIQWYLFDITEYPLWLCTCNCTKNIELLEEVLNFTDRKLDSVEVHVAFSSTSEAMNTVHILL